MAPEVPSPLLLWRQYSSCTVATCKKCNSSSKLDQVSGLKSVWFWALANQSQKNVNSNLPRKWNETLWIKVLSLLSVNSVSSSTDKVVELKTFMENNIVLYWLISHRLYDRGSSCYQQLKFFDSDILPIKICIWTINEKPILCIHFIALFL